MSACPTCCSESCNTAVLPFGIQVDFRQCRAWVGGREVELRHSEWLIFAVLAHRPGYEFRRLDLMEQAWQEWDETPCSADFHRLNVTIGRIRDGFAAAGVPRSAFLIRPRFGVRIRLDNEPIPEWWTCNQRHMPPERRLLEAV